jgi:hypothetical protein
MPAEISFDLVMEPVMDFVEGTYRVPGGDWQVFVFTPDESAAAPTVTAGRWSSGATGVAVAWPRCSALNEAAVLRTLGVHLGVTAWEHVRGPDSMALR